MQSLIPRLKTEPVDQISRGRNNLIARRLIEWQTHRTELGTRTLGRTLIHHPLLWQFVKHTALHLLAERLFRRLPLPRHPLRLGDLVRGHIYGDRIAVLRRIGVALPN